MSSSPVSVWCSASRAGSAGATDLSIGGGSEGAVEAPSDDLDHAVFLESLDGGGIEAQELAVDLRAVLAQERRAA